ncbi:P-loop NTPase family protein [Vibrio algarum]|uniref:Rad50/SbcC-type AAA domain-containing protein n=1 Tax=Vibrio algarum TaxID=3020714 RepID=A0ABT4YQU8_9VIBR|nr:hypothetical protein [Vibrio sp. KJ40-1]MDB1123404.1 hypothetical protein [Vibrio sp. KJ40-1]
MFKINFVSSDIRVEDSNKHYGFKYSFDNGLNIIKGQNSSGKSSILSCIYYNLGMEQLLGMSTGKSSLLDKCLTSEFIYQDTTHSVTQSSIYLEIENDEGEVVLLERSAVSPIEDAKNTIIVHSKKGADKYYLHAIKDHSHKHGFYSWLQEFIGIELPRDNETGKNTLYLQNVFSSCFIEQTKGWSDFMSQMPSFNIKNARKKLVEYLLSLECLDNDIEKDKLTNERASLVDSWFHSVKNFERVDFALSYKVNGLANKFERSSIDSLLKLQLKINIDSEWIDINTAKKSVGKELTKIRKLNRKSEKRKDLTELSEKRKDLKMKLLNFNRVKSSLDRAYTTEKYKINSYEKHLNRLSEERSNIIGARKVDALISELTSSEHCPLCDSTIEIISDEKVVTSTDYDNSLKFIDSKISMISSYIQSFSNYDDEYTKDSNYYDSLIFETRTEISNLDRDLNSNASLSDSRAQIHAEIIKSNLLDKLIILEEQFDSFKTTVNDINTQIVNIDTRIRNINQSFSSDDEIIKSFQETFRNYLGDFHYTSNEVFRVKINNRQPLKAFPSVYNASAGSAQPIRLASSASDFIRSEWAFYLALLDKSQVHPGILIFDEPGQHAMSLDSMSKLLELAENKKNKQIILAISKFTKGYNDTKEEQKISLDAITNNLTEFNEIEIDSDNEKLVSELKD